MEFDQREAVGPALAGRRQWIGLGVLAIAWLVYVMDLTVLHLAVPKLSADLQPTTADAAHLDSGEISDDPIPIHD